MRFRLKAFSLHLLVSASVLTLVLGGLYVGWYRYPGWYLADAAHIVVLVAAVDLALGPTLTLIVAHPRKPLRVLARDIVAIAVVQVVALVYGAYTLWYARPLYYAFSVDRLELVQASDVKTAKITGANEENGEFAPHWYSLPRWIWAPLPENPDEAAKIVESAVFGGDDVVQMPRYFKSWDSGREELRKKLRRVDEWVYYSRVEKRTLNTRMARLGVPVDRPNTLILWGGSRRVLVVFDPDLRIRVMLRSD
jgi:multisubunit Na+/H+ antiporter MnhF subunit